MPYDWLCEQDKKILMDFAEKHATKFKNTAMNYEINREKLRGLP